MASSRASSRRTRRYVAFSAVVTGAALMGANGAVGLLERIGWLDTHHRDDAVQFVDAALFEPDGDWIRTTAYAEDTMVHGRFRRQKGDAFRLMAAGASFVMGTPYQNQGPARSVGGIWPFVRRTLEERLPDRPVEVVNLGTGGADSGRVAEVVAQAVQQAPDVLFVATCNNDGAVNPAQWRRALQKQPGYRLLRNLLRDAASAERSWFAPQDEGSEGVREQLRGNLEALVADAAQAGVPVLLATLPVNLRYPGFSPLSTGAGNEGTEALFDAPSAGRAEVHPSLEGRQPCEAGIWLAQSGEWQAAVGMLRRCASDRSSGGMLPPYAPSYLALAELRTGEPSPWAEGVLRQTWGDCLADGMLAFAEARHDDAVDGLLQCEELAEGLQWAGLARWEQGRYVEAKAMLRQATELDPRNRCRPSMNDVIREVAAAHAHVQLVDLEAAAERLDPTGVPGPELFLDSCHMTWRGYAAMAGEVVAALEAHHGVPAGTWDSEAIGRLLGLPPGGNLEQVAWIMTSGSHPPPNREGPPGSGRGAYGSPASRATER